MGRAKTGKPDSARRGWRRRFTRIATQLVGAYGLPDLGNLDDPVDEIFYIVLSAKTTDALYRRAFQRLKERFKHLGDIAAASVEEIAGCVGCAGLGNKRAKQIKSIAVRLRELGPDPSTRLRRMDRAEAYDFLTGLEGVGPKSAFCVMMMSLGMDVFPVDVNVHRVARRLGVLPEGLKHFEAQKRLPPFIPRGRCKELHIGLLLHGRSVCLPRIPKCGKCLLRRNCAFAKRLPYKNERHG